MKKIISKWSIFFSSLFVVLVLFSIALSFNFTKSESGPPQRGNWYLQNLSGLLNGRVISDMTFIDSLTGFAIISSTTSTDTGFILRTTNEGDNWCVNNYYLGTLVCHSKK